MNYKRAVRGLLVSWFENEIASVVRGRKSSQILTGTVPKQNIGGMMREVIETSSFEFQIIPISVDGTSDLQAMALGHLVLHLPWDELQRKMTLEKLKSAGIGVDAGLATIVAPLLKIGANASFEA